MKALVLYNPSNGAVLHTLVGTGLTEGHEFLQQFGRNESCEVLECEADELGPGVHVDLETRELVCSEDDATSGGGAGTDAPDSGRGRKTSWTIDTPADMSAAGD